MHVSSSDITQKIFLRILIGITIFAFAIRLVSIDHNLPYQIIADEGSDLTTAVNLLQGELPARHVRYHRMLVVYNNMIPIAGVFAVNFIDGDVRSIADFQDLYFSNRAEFIYATRLWMSLLTSASIFFTGLAAAYVNHKVGLLAALILTLNTFYFHMSLFALPDVLGACMSALCIWTIMRVWKYRRTRDYILMSIALALVMLAKLNASVIGFGFLVAHGYVVFDRVNGDWRRLPLTYISDKNIWISAIVGILANIIFNPVAFIDLDSLIYELSLTQSNFASSEAQAPLSYYFDLTIQETGRVILIISRWITAFMFIALIPTFRRKLPAANTIILVILAAMIWLTESARYSPLSHFYYWTSVVIPIAICGAIGAGYVIEILEARVQKYAQYAVVGGVVLLLVLEAPFLWQMFNMMNRNTTQELAREWIIENIETDTAIISGDPIIFSVPLTRNEASINQTIDLTGRSLGQWNWYLGQEVDARPIPAFEIYGPEYRQVINTFDDLQTLIDEESIQYLVYTDYICLEQDDDPSNIGTILYPPRSEEMTEQWELVFSASSFASETCEAAIHQRTKIAFSTALYQQVRTGPYIEIYRIPQP